MLTLAVFADDLTGALDTGVQFAASGVKTAVTVGTTPPESCTVAVCDLETRHLSPAEAAARTAEAVRAAQVRGARYLYVKTDSGLRGNIGAALSALLPDGGRVLFAPAYPENGRVTVNGVHLIDGVPVSQSLFGRDARTPVRHDRVADILRANADVPISALSEGAPIPEHAGGVLVADAATDAALAAHARAALDAGITRFAGCAGFARQLASALALPRAQTRRTFAQAPLLVVCGSVSPVSRAQLAAARADGVPCFRINDAQGDGFARVRAALSREGCAVVASAFDEADVRENDTAGMTAQTVAAALGNIACHAAETCRCGLYVIGGDTLMAVVQALGACVIVPAFEAASGVVACSLDWNGGERLLVTKSGSFGAQDAITAILRQYARAL